MKIDEKKFALIVISLMFFVMIIGLLCAKAKSTTKSNQDIKEYYDVVEDNAVKFTGKSIISDQQKIIFDKSTCSLNEVFVQDGQNVNKDQNLFSYKDISVQNQIDQINTEINTNKNRLATNNQKLSQLNQKRSQATEEGVVEIDSEIQVQQDSIDEINSTINDLNSQINQLNSKLNVVVSANISGKVYINKFGIDDSSVEYIKIISNEPLIECKISEFDLGEIVVGDSVEINILSNEKKVLGEIISINELPDASEDTESYSNYSMYIKPKESIQIGLTVEANKSQKTISIPKECVYKKNDSLYVVKIKEGKEEKIKISATLVGDCYVLNDDSIKVCDKLLKNPLSY